MVNISTLNFFELLRNVWNNHDSNSITSEFTYNSDVIELHYPYRKIIMLDMFQANKTTETPETIYHHISKRIVKPRNANVIIALNV